MTINNNTDFSYYYNNATKSLPAKEDQALSEQMIKNLNKIGEIEKIDQIALPLFAKDGFIDLDAGSVGWIQRPVRGFIQRNIFSSISRFNDSIDNLTCFTSCVKKYFKKYTPRSHQAKEVQESLAAAIRGLEKLQMTYQQREEKHSELVVKDSIRHLRTTTETLRQNCQITDNLQERIDRILTSKVFSEKTRFNTLKEILEHEDRFIEALNFQSSDIQAFFNTSIFASNEKNRAIFLTSILIESQKGENERKNLAKFFSDMQEIEGLPIELRSKKEVELELIESMELFKPFIEVRIDRKAHKAAQVIHKGENSKSDYIAMATLKLLAGGGLAALAWKYPKFKGALPYVINFALSAYIDTQKYWQATSKEEKLLIIQDIELLAQLEKKTPGTILKMINQTLENRSREGAEEMEAIQVIVEKARNNLGISPAQP